MVEPLHADQKKGLPTLGSERRQRPDRSIAQEAGRRPAVAITARQCGKEALVKSEARRQIREDGWIGGNRLQQALHGGVSGALGTREEPRKSAQMWYMMGNAFGQ